MKYPRTQHLPWSVGGTADDVRLTDTSFFEGKTLVYTEKLDGENTILTSDSIHARSESGYGKPWQTWMKAYWATKRADIPVGMEICGECLYAIHSIEYIGLTDYFYVFNIIQDGVVLSWNDVKEWAALLWFQMVPEIKIGKLEELPIPESQFKVIDLDGKSCSSEGYVVRNVEPFALSSWRENIAKVVRKGHVQTDAHWTTNWRKATLCEGVGR